MDWAAIRRPCTVGATLSREGARLLGELGPPGRYAILDPTDHGALILRCARDGISLGGGRFRTAAVEELLRHDLVEELGSASRRGFRISEAGLARSKRGTAGRDGAFAAQHQDLVEEQIQVEGRKATLTVNASESPLGWLRRRKGIDGEPLIDHACFEAGERLRRDLTFASMLPRVTANWNGAVSQKGYAGIRDPASATDMAIAARQRAARAFEAVGPDFADLLIDLCGFLKGLEKIERDRAWPPRSGKVVVKLALRRLADHYGLRPAARGPERSVRIRSWHETGIPEPVQ